MQLFHHLHQLFHHLSLNFDPIGCCYRHVAACYSMHALLHDDVITALPLSMWFPLLEIQTDLLQVPLLLSSLLSTSKSLSRR